MLMVADDLTGAADCAVQGVRQGLSGLVAMSAAGLGMPADLVAVDADTRSLPAEAAAQRVADLVGAAPTGRRLFKKVDSTLRGHVGVELAAALRNWRAVRGIRAVALFAPAFPATGRTVIGGRPFLRGQPLETTELWRREGSGSSIDLPAMFQAAGLATAAVTLAVIRSGELPEALVRLAESADVLICDTEADADLAALATASLALGDATVHVGSAGLAGRLVRALGLRPGPAPAGGRRPVPALPLLFVVGSMSSVSRRQAAELGRQRGIRSLPVPLRDLVAGGEAPLAPWQERLQAALARGEDVVLVPEPDGPEDPGHALKLRRALAALVAPVAGGIGGLFLTGGETARAVLDACGVTGLSLHCEVEPGVPLATALGRHGFGVVTKAGAFGDERTMLHCRQALLGLRQPSSSPSATCGSEFPS